MRSLPNNAIVFYASSEPKYTGSVGIITSGFIFPTAEIKMQEVKFTFGTFWHEFTHLHEVKQFTDKQKQSLEKLKTTYPHLFMEYEMRNFQIGDWVTHSDYPIDGTVKGARSATGHYPVILDNGQEIKAHEDKLTHKNNVTALELAERRMPTIVATIKSFFATNLAQQLSPAQQAQLNKPGNYTTWQPLTPALIKADLERQAMEFINAQEEKQTTDTVPASTAQQPEALESNTQLRQEDSQATAEIVPQIELAQLARNTNAIIEIDVTGAIKYIDSRVTTFAGESEALEAELKKWFKELATRRLDLTRPVNDSLKQIIADEKKIGAYLDEIFAANKAKRDAAEAERRAKKHGKAINIMTDMLKTVDLPDEYLTKVAFREEYYNKTMTNKKIAESIQEQIDTQVNLYKGYLAEQELKQAKIANRELLIDNLNIKYSVEGKYSMFPIETFSDEQVLAKYEQNHQRKLELAKIEQERLDAEKIKNEVETTAEHSPQVEQSNLAHPALSTPTMANVSTHANPNNTTTAPEVQQIETVIMFKLVVTGHTQAKHDHSIPNFIEDIQAAVAVALTEPIAKEWAYSFEVVK